MEEHIPRGVAALEAVLESAQETARKSLDLAQSINRREDDCGQDIAFNRAIAFMKVSAKVGMALAKLKGEHTSNISIRKTEVQVVPPPPARLAPPREPVPINPFDPVRAPISTARARQWLKEHGTEGYEDWAEMLAEADADTAENRTEGQGVAAEGCRGEGDPPRNFGGSNSGK